MLPSHPLDPPLTRHHRVHERRNRTIQQDRANRFRSLLLIEGEHCQRESEIAAAEYGHEIWRGI